MRYIFLDCGAHLGESTKKWRRRSKGKTYEITMFEPNPNVFKKIDKSPVFNDCTKLEVAVSDNVGKVKLHGVIKRPETVGATLEDAKASFARMTNDDYIYVNTIDLSNYISEHFNKEDHIVLKLDIEGSEYSVLEKMIETGTIDYINRLLCEFHAHKMDKTFILRERKIKQILKQKNIPVEHWNAL